MTFKDSIDTWINSTIYKKLQAELQEKRLSLLCDKQLYKQMLQDKNPISDKVLEQTCDTIIHFFNLTREEKRSIDFLTEMNMKRYNKKELYFEFSRALVNWYFYLKLKLQSENYELAAKLRDVINIEIIEFRESLEDYCEEYIEANDEEAIQYVHDTVKEQFGF